MCLFLQEANGDSWSASPAAGLPSAAAASDILSNPTQGQASCDPSESNPAAAAAPADPDEVEKTLQQRGFRLTELFESEKTYVQDLEQCVNYIKFMR